MKEDTFSLPSTNNEIESDEKNPDTADLQAEIIALKEFVSREVCLLKK